MAVVALKNLSNITTTDAFNGWVIASADALHVAAFGAEWHEPSKAMKSVVSKLAEVHSNVYFTHIDAEIASDVAEPFDISVVPTFLFIKVSFYKPLPCSTSGVGEEERIAYDV